MKKSFGLLDVNYEVKDHQPELWIWGIDDEGKRILIIARRLSNQVVPAAKRILSMFGMTEDELLSSKTIKTLTEFVED